MAMDEQGLSDAAILLMSLGEEEAASVLRHLTPKEVQGLGETGRAHPPDARVPEQSGGRGRGDRGQAAVSGEQAADR